MNLLVGEKLLVPSLFELGVCLMRWKNEREEKY